MSTNPSFPLEIYLTYFLWSIVYDEWFAGLSSVQPFFIITAILCWSLAFIYASLSFCASVLIFRYSSIHYSVIYSLYGFFKVHFVNDCSVKSRLFVLWIRGDEQLQSRQQSARLSLGSQQVCQPSWWQFAHRITAHNTFHLTAIVSSMSSYILLRTM